MEFVLLTAVSIGVLVLIKNSVQAFTSKIWLGLAKKSLPLPRSYGLPTRRGIRAMSG